MRSGKRTPDFLEVELILPDSQMCVYRVPTVKVEHYTKDSIFEKKLLMLLPFYIMRYEKSADIIEKDSEKLQRLLSEYEDIRNKLGNKEKVRKGVGEVMGGKVLQLESERLREEGMAIGKAEGKAEGEARLSALINRLFLEGRSDEVQRVVTDVKWRQKLYGEYNL